MSTKIHCLINTLDAPVGFFFTGGQVCILVGAEHLLTSMAADGKTAVILSKANRELPLDFDQDTCMARHLTENFFAKIKQSRAIATRDDGTACSFRTAIYLVAAAIWLNLRQALVHP